MASVHAAQALMGSEWRDNAYYQDHRLRLQYSSTNPRDFLEPDAEWLCLSCQGDNFSWRMECFKCGAPRTEDSPTIDGDAPSCILKIQNLEPEATEEALEDAIKPIVPLKVARLVRDKVTGECRGFAFVHFYSVGDATTAMEKLDGQVLAGQRWPCRMFYARDRLDTGAETGPSAPQAAVPTLEAALADAGWEPKSLEEVAAEAAAAGDVVAAELATAAPELGHAVPAGYDYDVATGYMRDLVSGYYFDTKTGYFFSPKLQQWGTLDATGAFTPHPTADAEPLQEQPVKAGNGEGASGDCGNGGEVERGGGSGRVEQRLRERAGAVIGAAPRINAEAVKEAQESKSGAGGTAGHAVKGFIHRGKWAQRMQQQRNDSSGG